MIFVPQEVLVGQEEQMCHVIYIRKTEIGICITKIALAQSQMLAVLSVLFLSNQRGFYAN